MFLWKTTFSHSQYKSLRRISQFLRFNLNSQFKPYHLRGKIEEIKEIIKKTPHFSFISSFHYHSFRFYFFNFVFASWVSIFMHDIYPGKLCTPFQQAKRVAILLYTFSYSAASAIASCKICHVSL